MSASPKELSQRKRRGQRGTTKPVTLPAPFGGVNSSISMLQMPPDDCIYAFNFFPSRYGLRTRPGYYRWCPAVPAGDGIRTLIPCNASLQTGSNDRLFAVTNDGIYDVSLASVAPVKKYNFAVKTGEAGYCSWHNYTNQAGAQFVLICDAANGYIVHNVAANTFAAGSVVGAGGGAEAPPAVTEFAFVTVWKNRVWLVQRNSSRAWYLDEVDIIGGAARVFDFGSKFKYGGYLKGIWNWTQDGGAGMDDHLVAISSQGDVAVYTGFDPGSAANFQMRGMWFLGRTPIGRRFVLEEGGDLLVLTGQGVLSLSQLTAGLTVEDERVFYFTKKINSLLRLTFHQREDVYGYEINTMPRYAGTIVPTPKLTGERDLAWAYSYETKGWFMLRDLPINTIENWGTRVFFGDTLNNVWELAGVADRIDPGVSAGTPVEFSLMTTYQSYGAPAQLKRVHFLRPYWVGEALPQFGVEARYDFQLEESGTVPPFSPTAGALWDLSNWDNAVWGGGFLTQHDPVGATGLGFHVAVAMRGSSVGEAAFMGIDVLYDSGGML